MRFFGLDVHLDFCEVAVVQDGKVSRVGRSIRPGGDPGVRGRLERQRSGGVGVELRRDDDRPAARRSNVGRVLVCNAAETRAISHARVKSDRFDAAMLAKLLSAGMLKAVWVPDEAVCFAPAGRSPGRAGACSHQGEERGARRPRALPARPSSGE